MSNRNEREINDTQTDIGDISNQNKDEIDLELVKSIEKLVEEETNVAKASLGDRVSVSESQKGIRQETQEYNVVQMKTQILPDTDEVERQVRNTENRNLAKEGTKKEEIKKESSKEPLQTGKGSTEKKKRQLQMIIAAAIAVLFVTVFIIVIVMNSNHKKSYHYNYGKGTAFFEQKDYKNALQYLEKAYQTESGMKDTDLMFTMYQCYMQNHDEENALNMLKSILSMDKNNENALKALADYYYGKQDGETLNKLITDYKGTNGENYLTQYEVDVPQVSEKPGEYTEGLQISLFAADNCKIYFTTDGSQPDKKSTLYTEEISLAAGTTVIKAIAVDHIGVQSEIAEFQYEIHYKQPEPPVISPISGVYEAGEKIVMEAEEGNTIYYTLDGTIPTTSSDVYTEPIDMPEGNTVVSAITVSQHDLSSAIARRNYIVNPARTYTYSEAVDLLKSRMKELNILTADGENTPNGEKVTLTYLSKITADGMELYHIRCDLRKNGTVSTEGFYGVGVKNGQCYKVTGEEGAYTTVTY